SFAIVPPPSLKGSLSSPSRAQVRSRCPNPTVDNETLLLFSSPNAQARHPAPAVRHGCCSAGLACPLGSSTAAGSSIRPNQRLRAAPPALNRFALARNGFIAHL